MIKLPTWIMPTHKPAFNDMESGTSLEAVHKLYGAMNELIAECNSINEEMQKSWATFKINSEEDYELFKMSVQQSFQDLSKVVELKLMQIETDFEKEIEESTNKATQELYQKLFDSVVAANMEHTEEINQMIADMNTQPEHHRTATKTSTLTTSSTALASNCTLNYMPIKWYSEGSEIGDRNVISKLAMSVVMSDPAVTFEQYLMNSTFDFTDIENTLLVQGDGFFPLTVQYVDANSETKFVFGQAKIQVSDNSVTVTSSLENAISDCKASSTIRFLISI